MRQVIHDKSIQACVCGSSPKTKIYRTAKQRVATWLGSAVIIIFICSTIFDGYSYDDWSDPKGFLVIGIVFYALVRIPIEAYIYLRGGHSLRCSLRHAFYKTI